MAKASPAPIAAAFSRWLRATRTRMGRSRYAMARDPANQRDDGSALLSEANIKALEDNSHDPKLSTFVAVCQALGKPPGKVLGDLIKEDHASRA
jgi:hypothetical protein